MWSVDLDPTRGREQGGRRPALVLSVDPLNQSAAEIVIVLPLTGRDKRVRSHVPIAPEDSGLRLPSWIKCEDIRSVSTGRLGRRIGSSDQATLRLVEERVRILFGL